MKLKGIILLTGALLTGTITSCGFFGDESYSIKNVESVLNDNGSTTVTIQFTDGADMPDYTFTIPQSNGIKDVKAEHDAANEKVVITISFTEASVEDYIIEVPIISGNGISEITEKKDKQTGETKMVISFTDGRPDVEITIPNGERGVGIKSITPTYNEDRTVLLTIEFDDGVIQEVLIPAPLDGVGIAFISSSIDPATGKTKIVFSLTDGSSQEIFVERAATWHSGYYNPNNIEEFGYVGDFYFEKTHYMIYEKTTNGWELIANLGESTSVKKRIVTFNLNDEDGIHADFVEGSLKSYEILEGRNFISTGIEMPLATREGYKFNGWYTSSIVGPTTGLFTDLTPVFSDIQLWANWIKL